MPATPWQAKTSRASSIRVRARTCMATYTVTAATAPITSAARGVTKPAAGVIATNPTIAPVAAPTAVVRRLRVRSSNNQHESAAAAAACVFTSAVTATPDALNAEPALKPNHPNHSKPAPRRVNGTLWGTSPPRAIAWRRPSSRAATSAAVPALTWTTVPPAKSSAPNERSHPPSPQTQRASGSYTSVVHARTNSRYAEKRQRSTTAPETNATVIAANIAWNAANARCGTVAAYAALGAAPTPASPHHDSPPTHDDPGPNAIE